MCLSLNLTEMNIYEIIGVSSMIYMAPKVITYILSLIGRLFTKNPLIPRPGDFAIITGATDGIGLEYARQLAEKGYNLLLLSRTESKLKKIKNSIIADDDVEVRIVGRQFILIFIFNIFFCSISRFTRWLLILPK